ncbi:hypothetical protein AAF712_014429 [Marasmius tenuissimus]|uniref:Uncharacterized protein n=1 Tax=Marasmius tenuissimus TaxID=585030 RepID=A0ABR2ZC33_9AGAR
MDHRSILSPSSGLTGTTHPVESAAMTPSVRVLRQTDHYIDIHLDAEVQHGSSEDTPGRNHTASSQPMPVLLQLGVDRESFLRSMVIRVGVIHTTTIPTDLNHPSHDTTLIDVDLEPSAASSESPKNHSLALQSSPNNSDNHCSSPSGSQTPSQNFDFTLTTQDSQLLSTQTANFLYMCEEREDLIVDRAARAIETASGKYFLRPEHLAEISYSKRPAGTAICDISPRTVLATNCHKPYDSGEVTTKSRAQIDTSPIVKNGRATLAEISQLLSPCTPMRRATARRVVGHGADGEMSNTQNASDGSTTDSEPNSEIEDIWDDVQPSQSSEIPIVRPTFKAGNTLLIVLTRILSHTFNTKKLSMA